MKPWRSALLFVPLATACERGREESASWEGDASYVAEDAGRIPLTTPGTATRMERQQIEMPLPPLEEVPAPVSEEPFEAREVEPESPDSADITQEPPSRQPRGPEPVAPARRTPPPPPEPPVPAPQPSDTSRPPTPAGTGEGGS